MEDDSVCTICYKPLYGGGIKVVRVGKRGLATFIAKSKLGGDGKWREWERLDIYDCHGPCRQAYGKYGAPPSTQSTSESAGPSHQQNPPSTRSTSESAGPSHQQVARAGSSAGSSVPNVNDCQVDFDYVSKCFICYKTLNSSRYSVSRLSKEYMHLRLIEIGNRRNDNKGTIVVDRLKSINSLITCKAQYHHSCYRSFISIPVEGACTQTARGIAYTEEFFAPLWEYIESGKPSPFTIPQLREVLGNSTMDIRTLISAIKKKYNEDVYIERTPRKGTFVYYKRSNLPDIVSDWYCDPQLLDEDKKIAILNVAAGILRADVCAKDYNFDFYPAAEDFLDDVSSQYPSSLKVFLNTLLMSDADMAVSSNFVKRDTIAHSIVSIIRPRSFSSTLQLALGTYIYRKTGSKLIINLLNKLGFCESYNNIQLYEASTIMHPSQKNVEEDTFVQFVFDNTDHNVRTLDGRQTFHCLGGIAVHTPGDNISCEGLIQKCKKMPSAADLAAVDEIPLVPYVAPAVSGLKKITFEATDSFFRYDCPSLLNSYSAYVWAKFADISMVPTWRGYMEVLSRKVSYLTSKVTCLPFINAAPSSLIALNTAVDVARKGTLQLNNKTTLLTFDLPLYMKTKSIIAHLELKDVYVRLGGFHTLMSYLGAIGYIMAGSGLEDVWKVAYASESVKMMMTGHHFSRSLRAHILTFTALGMVICDHVHEKNELKQDISNFFRNWDTDAPLLSDFDVESVVDEATEKFNAKFEDLKKLGPTSQLWLQYFNAVLTALRFVEAERRGDWQLHLDSVRKMLPIFYAAGHYQYTKAAWMYLQDMYQLELTMDDEEFKNFAEKAFFTIRRSDKAWSGVWSDMTIEQTLNRFFGTDLKHGRGVTPSVVSRYLLGMPSAFGVMNSLEEYCQFKSLTSEQHVDLTNSRQKRDADDLNNMYGWFNDLDQPVFKERAELIALGSGVIAGSDVDCHKALEKGRAGLLTMVGHNASNISLSKLYKVKNLETVKKAVHISADQSVSVDPSLLFQRMCFVSKGNEAVTKECLGYELSPYPLSIFDDQGFMRKSPKSELYKLFTTTLTSTALFSDAHYVLDGGWLLHAVVWPHGKTFLSIFEVCTAYIHKHFGKNVTVVFDGYDKNKLGTKSYERYRREKKTYSRDMIFSPEKLITVTQKQFLSNEGNKAQFVTYLSEHLEKVSVNVEKAVEDADYLIVRTAINLKSRLASPVVVVGNDVDLFVLMIAHCNASDKLYFQKMATGDKGHKVFEASQYIGMKPYILFAHAFAGCDTTSSMFRKGKTSLIKILQRNEAVRSAAATFYRNNCTEDELLESAEKIVLSLYGARLHVNSIAELRYNIFATLTAAKKKEITLNVLPPTPSALIHHAKRVYLQVQQWLGRELEPEKWGWKKTTLILIPIMSTADVAPKHLLDMIFCACTSKCNSARCSCRKAGLKCNACCKGCNGESCDNAATHLHEEDVPEEMPMMEPDEDMEEHPDDSSEEIDENMEVDDF